MASNEKDEDVDKIYYLGIIDIFTLFSPRKRGESLIKRMFEGKGASCVDAKTYAKRFLAFCGKGVGAA